MSKTNLVSIEKIEKAIYLIRGEKVMLDRDLAKLYDVSIAALNPAVRRNRDRFPEDFMFQLISAEIAELNRSQIVIGSQKHRNPRSRPYAFTEQGVAMLSSVFNIDFYAIPVKVCGDTSAEANETLRVLLTNTSGATLILNQGIGTIVNDDVLELALEESGPTQNQAGGLDALLLVRDPFRIVGIPDWFPTGVDRNTRVSLFARNLQLNPGELPLAVVVRFTGSNSQIFEVQAEAVQPVPNTDLTQVVVRVPNNLAAGNCTVFIRAHTRTSNTGTIRIAP